MAKWEGTQSVPAEWLDLWRGNLTDKSPLKITRKRYPFRRRLWRKGGYKVTEKQKAQRERFELAISKFKTISDYEKSRWYDSMPPWHSLLWYYNYFMLSALNDVLGAIARGMSVIKKIQNFKQSVPAGGGWITFGTAVDPQKCVIMIWGGAYKTKLISWMATAIAIWEGGEKGETFLQTACMAWPIFPVWDSLGSSLLSVGWAETPDAAANQAVQVIEYI